MIINHIFDGDSELDLQARAYGSCLGIIQSHVAERLNACQTNEFDKISNLFMRLDGFDHRPWKFFHDCIADVARFDRQISNTSVNNAWTVQEWHEEFSVRLSTLLNNEPQLSKYLALAVIYPNPSPLGIEAEDHIEFSIVSQYQSKLEKLDSYKVLFSLSNTETPH
ncbi:hypothetical protein K2B98_004579 [Vibrio parahaemolyticus]|nr:hypothetical protein [Vibrio parahaemolyticus]EGQ9499058.1 hypothetical protein [Vibrio parahaemolyticus]EGQ9507786.1 hypothetical protein [Vibrio parahaemolyticus]EGQ9813926.1 hypothetical protein [Vibrio parahaemolyticus]EGR0045614.1 hypothetical protein [Vibrio parahaemolyticus]